MFRVLDRNPIPTNTLFTYTESHGEYLTADETTSV